jgi:hypothetical protein
VGEVLHRLLQTVRFERDAFVWMDFNDRATGDAFILVVVTQILLFLAGGNSLLGLATDLPSVIGGLLDALIFWLVFAALAYAAARFLFRGEGGYATFLRFTGFAFPTLLLGVATNYLISNNQLAFIAGAAWFLAIVAYGIHYVSDLDLPKAAVSAIGALLAWIVLSAILSGGLF